MSAPAVSAQAPGRLDAEAAGRRLSALFAEHGRMVYGLCRLLLRDPEEAEDAAQQTFLSAYRGLLSGTEPRDEGAWLAAITRNECRGRIRDRMRRPLGLGDAVADGSAPSPHETAEVRAEVRSLRAAIEQLPERQRHAIVLRDLYGLGYGEVCAALGLSLPAVESLLFRARRGLKLRLRPAATALLVPLSLRDALAQTIPAFAGGGAPAAGLAGKLVGLPLAAKVAAASLAVTTVGGVAAVESRHAETPASDREAAAAAASVPALPPGSAPVPTAFAAEEEPDEEPRERGGGDDESDGRSGPNGADDGERGEDDDRSGPGGGEEEAEEADDRSPSGAEGEREDQPEEAEIGEVEEQDEPAESEDEPAEFED